MELWPDEIRLHPVTLPLREPFETALEREVDRPLLVVEARAGELRGYGEVAATNTPYYYAETLDTARLILRDFLVPRVLAEPLRRPEDARRRLAPVRGWPLAKAGLEAALLDLWARRLELPLWRFLGGTRPEVPCGTSIGLRAGAEELLERVARAVSAGSRRVKLKIAPGWDVELLAAVRARFPALALAVDGNEGYGEEHVDHLAGLGRFGLAMVEQPFGATQLDLHARLARRLAAPVALDDSIGDLEEARHARRIGALGVLNVKAPRMGGAIAGRGAAAWAQGAGVPAFCGGLLDSGIGKSHALALATCAGFSLPADATPSAHHFEHDLVDPPVTMENGRWRPDPRPGIGVAVDRGRLE